MEAAGIALAVFPLVVKGLVGYLEGVKTGKDIVRWRTGLECLIRELNSETAIFRDICYKVLGGALPPADVSYLMNGGNWDNHYVRAVEEGLGEHKAHAFIDEFKAQCSVLQELNNAVGFEENAEVDTKPPLLQSHRLTTSPHRKIKVHGENDGSSLCLSSKRMTVSRWYQVSTAALNA